MIFARKHGSQTSYLVTRRECCWVLSYYVITVLFFSFVIVSEQHIENEAFRTPWIPKHFLEDYTFNSDGSCPRGVFAYGHKDTTQCLVLDDVMKDKICGGDNVTKDTLGQVHLRFCVHHNLRLLLDALDTEEVLNKTTRCRAVLDNVETVDLQVRRLGCEFLDVLGRYDCSEGYSVNWNCTACVNAYRAWVCSMFLPVYYEERLVKPCRSFCHLVEQRCPYFHPFLKEQYAGEPVFKCIDRNIPDIPSITPNTAYGPQDNCYRPCHLNSDLEPAPPDATACNFSSLPTSSPGNVSGTVLNSRSPAGRASARSSAVVASLLLWWALGFRLYRTPGRTKRHLWREPT